MNKNELELSYIGWHEIELDEVTVNSMKLS
jgi:hypothetical protein